MIKGRTNYWIGFILLALIISFFFYKSVFKDLPLDETLSTIEEVQDLQVQLHRDLLRYRSNQIKQYDILNNTLLKLDSNIMYLSNSNVANNEIGTEVIRNLKSLIKNESDLVEDFKTHHSILQNSLFYIFNVSTDLYSTKPKAQSKQKLRTTAELITLLLEYNENPEDKIANRIYPLIDSLNQSPDTDTNALINHSLMIIERLPEIDEIINRFNSLNVENQIILIKNTVSNLKEKQEKNAQLFNILLFLCTIYLVFYILYIFITLRKNEAELSNSNDKLNDEVKLRTRTEKALYQLVNIDNNRNTNNDEDRILFLLNALCQSLDAEYAYISRTNASGTSAEMIGLLDHGMFTSNITYKLIDTPCEEVIKNHRLVHDKDFSNYFPDCHHEFLQDAVSYLGVSLIDKNENSIGLLAIASKSPISDTNLAENILTIATSRSIIELEYQIEINNNKRYKQGLAQIDDWIARLITEGYDRHAFFKNVCRAAQDITGSQLAAFPALHSDEENYHFIAASGLQSEKLESLSMRIDDGGLCAWTIANNKKQLINDVATHSRAKKQLTDIVNIKSALLTPVTLNDRPYGAISVFKMYDDFDIIDEQLMSQFSQSVQMAIINMQLVSDIRSERERAEVTLHSIGDAVITTNVNGEIEYMNHVAESLTAWSLNEAKSITVQNVFRIEDIDTGEPIHDVVMSCLDDGIIINKSAISLVSRNGNKKDIESSISPILNTSGKAEGVVIVFHDETQRRHLESTIKHQAAHDSLTDLLNRDAFDTELSDHVYGAINNNQNHVLCYLDLDRFKLINDTAGHSAGDQCLIQITSLIQSHIRGDDILGRLGGDEFGLILKNCSQQSALKVTNTIVGAIANMPFNWDGCDYKLGVSIGINPLNSSSQNAAEEIRKADLACYTAKDQGKSQVYVYEKQDSELIRRQQETIWATRITEAIEHNRLCLYAQPIASLKNKKPLNSHVEILVRLIDDGNQIISPAAFIPAAERYNLMHLIDRKVIRETFAYINKYSENDTNNTLYSINLSGNTLTDKDIIRDIKDMVSEFDINTKSVCFEITETAAIQNLKQAKKLIKELKSTGFKFALDDFGSGLSSFQYLKNLPVDFLKIDGSFVADMVNNTIDYAMVAAINEVGHVMGIETIAEYVENDQIIKKLKEINVDYGQGYGIEQPKPIEEILPIESNKKSPSLKIIHNKPGWT
ncbi:diguanylate cyclase/phosphodiesterase (GGDEF & EAL domains) with PAS/PAC sensor(s) [hydrothermal vent metagenome]|uniref:Diguanylate cyclase/phosphodiesterase (GGDEF & EAL domains) with PAS/PAC sensor(S) n=1 Tax=hydrothermal vent metagenome TaxID=652676 RepID=A0A3B0WRB2_9ZZZZ